MSYLQSINQSIWRELLENAEYLNSDGTITAAQYNAANPVSYLTLPLDHLGGTRHDKLAEMRIWSTCSNLCHATNKSIVDAKCPWLFHLRPLSSNTTTFNGCTLEAARSLEACHQSYHKKSVLFCLDPPHHSRRILNQNHYVCQDKRTVIVSKIFRSLEGNASKD